MPQLASFPLMAGSKIADQLSSTKSGPMISPTFLVL